VTDAIQPDGSVLLGGNLSHDRDSIDWEQLGITLKRELADLARSTPLPSGDAHAVRPTKRTSVVQAVLEVLEAAGDNGLPTLQDIADKAGYELDTVKKARPRMQEWMVHAPEKGHEGAWVLTQAGRDQLKLMRAR
jgi:hypothetical protein